ncbi:helix-turn-helix domain-containing protein [Sphingomonas sp. QA11]|uniref:XRE family transcriptional regulator n=1 Tax=Sphingomonas sp. QA11 TaxID=2950605 RepID=UPI00234A4FC4|nr:S24 family peptidase [Sphingomonas sp. QA11]WCM29211.1 helix-turn-helix domain-containing protein [Sphingomonas sp. QA11]
MIISERVRSLMEARGLSQSELARRVQVTQGAIAKIVNSNPGGSSHLHKIARELGTTASYLTGETDDPAEGALPTPTPAVIAQQLDLVPIQSIDLAYGMGASFTDGPIETEILHFPRVWIESITSTPPALLTWAKGRGDSMIPTIHSGDMVIIDRSQKVILEPDAIWAYTVGDIGGIKRLKVKGDRVIIMSDNKLVNEDSEPIDEIRIVGRIAFIGRLV